MEKRRRRRKTRSNCNSNGEEEEEKQRSVADDLPHSIVVDILLRLPIRTLLKCRGVCKTWRYLLLQDPYFTKIRLARASIVDDDIVIAVQGSLFWLELGEDSNYVHRPHWPIRFRIGYNILNRFQRLVGSCNGLLCLRDFHPFGALYISNPILGECVALPQPKTVGYAVAYAFGFSPTTGHYKVLRFRPHSEVEVYILGTDTWRNVGNAPYPAMEGGCNVTLNGAVHWMVSASVTGSEFIYSFDIDEEQFCPIPTPPELRNTTKTYRKQMRLGVLGNYLCIYYNSWDYLDIWSMIDYGVAESWTKVRILKISILSLMKSNLDLYPITLWKDGEMLLASHHGILLSYNHKIRSITALKVHYIKEKVKVIFGFHALPYRPSFFSLKDFASRGGLKIVKF